MKLLFKASYIALAILALYTWRSYSSLGAYEKTIKLVGMQTQTTGAHFVVPNKRDEHAKSVYGKNLMRGADRRRRVIKVFEIEHFFLRSALKSHQIFDQVLQIFSLQEALKPFRYHRKFLKSIKSSSYGQKSIKREQKSIKHSYHDQNLIEICTYKKKSNKSSS